MELLGIIALIAVIIVAVMGVGIALFTAMVPLGLFMLGLWAMSDGEVGVGLLFWFFAGLIVAAYQHTGGEEW